MNNTEVDKTKQKHDNDLNSSILENDYLNEKYPDTSQGISLQESLKQLQNLTVESEKVLEHLFKLSQQPEIDSRRVDDLIDSLFYEHKIRVRDGITEIDKLQIKNEIITDNQCSV